MDFVLDSVRPLPALLHLLVFGALIPLGAWRSLRHLQREPLPPKTPYLLSVIVQQIAFGAIALGIAGALDLDLFPAPSVTWRDAGLGLALLGTALVLLAPYWRVQVRRGDRFVYLVAPRTRRERWLWAGVAVAAGLSEEIVYRGVFFSVVASLVNVPTGIVVASLAFGLGHLAQGRRAAPIVWAFGMGFQALVLATGSLYVAMVVHLGYDLIAGLAYGYLADRYGYPREPLPPVGAAASLSDSAARTPS